jgi:hypothetical protein
VAGLSAALKLSARNRAQYSLRASPGAENGSPLPAWTTRCVSGTSRISRGGCNTSIEVDIAVCHMRASHEGSSLPGICLDLDWLDDELFASCSADKVIHVLSVNHAEPIAVLTLVPVSPDVRQTLMQTSLGDTTARSTRSRQTHREHASCRVLMT